MPLTAREESEVAAANAADAQPVVFVHGLWMLAGSWDRWRARFEERGYRTIAVDWPDDPPDREAALARPEAFAGKTVAQVADHVAEVIQRLQRRKPVVIGHSFGGLMAQIVAGRALAAGAVAIDPAPFRGVLPLPLSTLKASFPVLGNPLNRSKAVMLTLEQFTYGFANAVSADEARQLYETYCVPAPGRPLFQAALANINWRTECRVDTTQTARGPLLIISGERDHIVPTKVARAAQQRYKALPAELVEIPDRGHSLCIDSGWEAVADTALAFMERNGLTP
ncbi:MAG TPA: alpha/beta hydrolase [Ilumatobacteraceae bacterium]|nr:alpha/beta hydrolase [Ilumatobacteraceae bacterium]